MAADTPGKHRPTLMLPASRNHTLCSSQANFPSMESLYRVNYESESPSGRSHDPEMEKMIENEWLNEKMRDRRTEYTSARDLAIVCGTWNVNGKKFDSSDGDLREWLFPTGKPPPDVVVLGFQEIVDLNAVNVAMDVNTVKRSKEWQTNISACLKSSAARYVHLACQHLVGVFMCIFVKADIEKHVKDVRVATHSVGLMGVLGNKGGVAIRCSIFDNSYCFICAHLAAHRENVSGRNADARNIFTRLIFAPEHADVEEHRDRGSPHRRPSLVTGEPVYGAKYDYYKRLAAIDHECVFFLGDLNYRIVERVDMAQIFDTIKTQDEQRLQSLREHDQLNVERARRSGTIFDSFEEGPLLFDPTYKYQPGTSVYDQRPEKKVRAPAWCDRVLWRLRNQDISLRQLSYCAVSKYTCSDHKPVQAHFVVKARVVLPKEEHTVYNSVMKAVRLSHSGMGLRPVPKIELSNASIIFKSFRFGQPQTAEVSLRNAGTSVAHFRFVERFGELGPFADWLDVSPAFGLLLPGEVTRISVTGMLDLKTIREVNAGNDSLDDVLVLRVERAYDHYVSVHGELLPSCLGQSLETLCCTPTAIRDTLPWWQASKSGDEIALAPQIHEAMSEPLVIPTEIVRLVQLFADNPHYYKCPGLLVDGSDDNAVRAVVDALDTGAPFPSPGATAQWRLPLAAANALVLVIQALQTPVLPLSAVPLPSKEREKEKEKDRDRAGLSIDEAHRLERKMALIRLVRGLPPAHSNVLFILLAFFREVLSCSSDNGLTLDRLLEIAALALTDASNEWSTAAEKAVAELKELLGVVLTDATF